MDAQNRQQQAALPVESKASSELIRRIRKLRWAGLDDEADKLEKQLSECSKADTVLATPTDTD